MPEPLHVGASEYRLERWPLRTDESLRAWDTADLYLLNELAVTDPGRLLVANDTFAALTPWQRTLLARHPARNLTHWCKQWEESILQLDRFICNPNTKNGPD